MQQEIKEVILKPREFKTRADVFTWFFALLNAGICFHPDDTAGCLIDVETHERTFTPDEGKRYDALMEEAIDACALIELDVCDVACEAHDAFMAKNQLAPTRWTRTSASAAIDGLIEEHDYF